MGGKENTKFPPKNNWEYERGLAIEEEGISDMSLRLQSCLLGRGRPHSGIKVVFQQGSW